MNRFIFKIFYLGNFYTGFQRQPNGRAIENYIEYAFMKSRFIESFKKNSYKSCSRTDANVSAISNIISIDSDQLPNLLEINSYLPGNGTIIIWDFAQVPLNFNPRDVLYKTYEYYIKNPSQTIKRNILRINSFLGYHNYQDFIKKEGAGKFDPYSNVYTINLNFDFNNVKITISGNKFGREQIRRMIGFITEVQTLENHLLKYRQDHSIKPASPDYLILKEIKYQQKIKWETDFFTKQILFKKSIVKLEKLMQENSLFEYLLNYL